MGASRTTERPNELPDWRQRSTDNLPTPMVSTGLGLFGLRESPFVDRDDERDRIWQALQDVVDNDTFRLVVVAGNSGTGKSRLARWVARRAHEVGAATTLRATHTPGGRGRFEGLGGLVRRAVRGWQLDRSELHQHLLETLPTLPDSPQLRDLDARALTELAHPTDRGGDIDGPSLEFDSLRQQHALTSRLLRRVGRDRPVLVWFDDIQWSDRTVEFLEYLTEAPDRAPALVVATVRTELMTEDPQLDNQITRLDDRAQTDRIDLKALDARAHRWFIDRLLPLRPRLADRLAERTEGNPLFAHQVLRKLVADDQLRATDEGFALREETDLQLPDDIHELWARRLVSLLRDYFPDRVDETGQAVELAATLGRKVVPREWRAVCEMADVEIPEGLVDRLVERGLAEHTDSGWAFTHGLFVDSIRRFARDPQHYPPDHQRHHHRCCARMLEQLYPHRPHQTARRRADHWIEAQEFESSLTALFEESRRLERLGATRRRYRVLRRRADIIERLGLSALDARRLENAYQLVNVEWMLGKTEQMESRLRRLVDRCQQTELWGIGAMCLGTLAVYLHHHGDSDCVGQLFERATSFIDRADDDQYAGQVHLVYATYLRLQGNLQAAEQQARRAEQRLDNQPPHYRFAPRLALGQIQLARGEFDAARSRLRRLADNAEKHGTVAFEIEALNALSKIACYHDDISAARRLYDRLSEMPPRITNLRDLLETHLSLAQIGLLEGDFDRVDDHLGAIRALPSDFEIRRRYQVLLEFLRLALEAGTDRRASFDRRLDSLTEDSSLDQLMTTRDHPWVVERAADCCLQHGATRRATRLLKLAARLWDDVGDDEARRTTLQRLSDR